MNSNVQRSRLFWFACGLLKCLTLSCLGLAIALVLSAALGMLHVIVRHLPLIGQYLGRGALVVLCIFAIAVIYESWR